jgi:hypothetical protein
VCLSQEGYELNMDALPACLDTLLAVGYVKKRYALDSIMVVYDFFLSYFRPALQSDFNK